MMGEGLDLPTAIATTSRWKRRCATSTPSSTARRRNAFANGNERHHAMLGLIAAKAPRPVLKEHWE